MSTVSNVTKIDISAITGNLNLLRTEEAGSQAAKVAVVAGKEQLKALQKQVTALVKDKAATHQAILEAQAQTDILISNCGETRKITKMKYEEQTKAEAEKRFAALVKYFPKAPTHEVLNRDIDASIMLSDLQRQSKVIEKKLREFNDHKSKLGSVSVRVNPFSDVSIGKSAEVTQGELAALFGSVSELKVGDTKETPHTLWNALTYIGADPAKLLKYASEASRTLLVAKLQEGFDSKKVPFTALKPNQIHHITFEKVRDANKEDLFKVTISAQLPVAAGDKGQIATVDAVMVADVRVDGGAKLQCSFSNVLPYTSISLDEDSKLESAFAKKSLIARIKNALSF